MKLFFITGFFSFRLPFHLQINKSLTFLLIVVCFAFVAIATPYYKAIWENRRIFFREGDEGSRSLKAEHAPIGQLGGLHRQNNRDSLSLGKRY